MSEDIWINAPDSEGWWWRTYEQNSGWIKPFPVYVQPSDLDNISHGSKWSKSIVPEYKE